LTNLQDGKALGIVDAVDHLAEDGGQAVQGQGAGQLRRQRRGLLGGRLRLGARGRLHSGSDAGSGAAGGVAGTPRRLHQQGLHPFLLPPLCRRAGVVRRVDGRRPLCCRLSRRLLWRRRGKHLQQHQNLDVLAALNPQQQLLGHLPRAGLKGRLQRRGGEELLDQLRLPREQAAHQHLKGRVADVGGGACRRLLRRGGKGRVSLLRLLGALRRRAAASIGSLLLG
jgi:hypothetical protein